MKLTKTCLFLFAMTAMLIGFASSALADANSANLLIGASIKKSCNIATSPISFGDYSPLSGNPADANGTVTVTCTKNAVTTIGLGRGVNNNRTMADGSGNYLPYELHKTSVTGPTWGDSGSELLDTGTAPDKNPRSFTVFGRIPANEDQPEGTYTDTVVATVNF